MEKLRAFDSYSPSIFADISALETALSTGVSQINSAWDASQGLFIKPSNLTWMTTIANQFATKDMTKDELAYIKTLTAQYGFDTETAVQIIKVKRGIDAKFPKMKQEERDYLLLRVIGSVSYGTVNGAVDGALWDASAGDLKNYFSKEISGGSGTYSYTTEMTFSEIMLDLGLTKEQADGLYKNLTLQHGLSGEAEDFATYDSDDLFDYANKLINNYKTNKGIEITVEEVLQTIKTMSGKADFTHQSITMATHLRPSSYLFIDEHVNDLAGWEGDTTYNANDRKPSIGNDDYLADLDSVNLVHRMASGKSYMAAFTDYHEELTTGAITRESEFKRHVPLKEVKDTIFASLVPDNLSGTIISIDPSTGTTLYEPPTESQSMAYLKEHYEGSYTFIKSLEDENNLFEEAMP